MRVISFYSAAVAFLALALSGPATGAEPTADRPGFRVDKLIGSAVRSPDGRAVGTVEDVVIDPASDKVAYLMLAAGPVHTIGEKLTPVPWQDFSATSTDDFLVLDASASTVAAAPKIELRGYGSADGFDRQRLAVDEYWKTRIGFLRRN